LSVQSINQQKIKYMKKSFILSLILAVPAVLSCQKGADVSSVPADGRIRFDAGGPAILSEVTTRADVVNAASLNSSGFNVTATTGSAGSESLVTGFSSVAFTKGATYFEADKWWPSTNPSYHFYSANSAITFAAAGCTVSANAANDVVCAYMPSPSYLSPNTLSFAHIFARVGSCTVTAVDGYTISGVSVSITPKTSGTYNIRTGNGSIDGTGWSSTSNGSAVGIANATPGTKSNDVWLVPGSYDLTVTWTAAKDNYSYTFSNRTVNVALQGGKVNNISLGLTGDADKIQFSVSVADWGSNAIDAGTVEASRS
jgi:hypothetical protein